MPPLRALQGCLILNCLFFLSPALAQNPEPSALANPDPASAGEVKKLREAVKKLQLQVKQLTEKSGDDELARLAREAEEEAKAPDESNKPREKQFLWGALALQKLNPEISISVDILAQLIIDGDRFYAGRDDRTSMPVREVGINFQHVLDPYSTFKATINFTPWPDPAVEPEEMYITWSGLVRGLSFTVGRFRQQFGTINRWHEHDLDQTGYPMGLELALGEGGVVSTGVSVKWFMPPLWAHAMELTLEVTDGENETLFAGEFFSVPTFLLHLKNYWDLTENTYLELGLSGIFGFNNRRGYADEKSGEIADEPWRKTVVLGADLTLHWSPLRKARYRSLTWRTEFYWVHKENPAGWADDARQSWGAYSYLDYQLSETWFCGVRLDAALPTERNQYGDTEVAWGVTPYVTFWQSEFVYLRLEYQHGQDIPHRDSDDKPWRRRMDNRVLFQIDFAAGPHKHEKY